VSVSAGFAQVLENPPLIEPEKYTGRFLYKYRTAGHWERLRDILLKHELYFPTAEELNDPREARPTIHPRSSAEFGAMLRRYAPTSPGETPENYRRTQDDLEHSISRLENRFLVRKLEEHLYNQMKHHRVFSFGTHPDNPELWRRYADHHRGYCLEFRNDPPIAGFAFVVRYQNRIELDVMNGVNNWFLCYKTKKWEFEEEVRVLGGRTPDPVRLMPELLSRIILGKRISESSARYIRGLAAQRIPALPVIAESEL